MPFLSRRLEYGFWKMGWCFCLPYVYYIWHIFSCYHSLTGVRLNELEGTWNYRHSVGESDNACEIMAARMKILGHLIGFIPENAKGLCCPPELPVLHRLSSWAKRKNCGSLFCWHPLPSGNYQPGEWKRVVPWHNHLQEPVWQACKLNKWEALP